MRRLPCLLLALILASASASAQETPVEIEEVDEVEEGLDELDEVEDDLEEVDDDAEPDDAVEEPDEPEPVEPVVPEPDTRRLTLLVAGNLDGNLARVNCRQELEEMTLYRARQAAYVDTLRDLATDPAIPEPLFLSPGDSLFPGVLARYFLSLGEPGARTLAQSLTAVPLEVHGLGSREFTVDRGDLLNFMEAMEERGVNMQAANLACEGFQSAEAICAGLSEERFKVVERDGTTVAIATILTPDLIERLDASQKEGLQILDPAEILPGLVEEMREAADVVVIQHQLRPRNALDRSYELASKAEGIDLMISNFLFDGESEARRSAVVYASHTGTPIVSGNSGANSLISLELALREAGEGAWQMTGLDATRVNLNEMPDHRATAEILQAGVESFCEDWGSALGDGATIAEPMSLEDLRTFVLNAMRFSTRSEVAILNTGAFRNDDQFPLTGELTAADLYTAMPFENQIVTARISGARLKALAPRLGDILVAEGLTVDGDTVLINGRPVADDRQYPVAMNDFLAGGGDGIFAEDHLSRASTYQPEWADEAPTIDEAVIHFVSNNRHLQAGEERAAVSPRGNFQNLHRRFLWTFQGSMNASYNQVAVQNPVIDDAPAYDQGQLTVQATDQINMEGRFATQADSRNHRWNNELNLQYATARLRDQEDANFEKTRDQIRLRSRYRYQRLRVDRNGRWYVPDPLVEGQLESEFIPPETRDWHRLDLRAIAGMSFQLRPPLDFRIGLNVRQDVNEPDSAPTWGLTAGYTLSRINLVTIMNRPVHIESEVEYFYNDIGGNNVHEIRSGNRLFYSLFGQLFFTTTFNVFAVRNDTVGEFGTNTELTIGLNYQWDASFQRF